MKDFIKLAKCYSMLDINRNDVFCHSIDKGKYKILCENFFQDEYIVSKYIQLAEEDLFASNESEKQFLHWLNLE